MLQVQEMGCDHRVLKCQQNSKQVGNFLQGLAPARDMCLEEGKINSIDHSVEVQPCKGVDGTQEERTESHIPGRDDSWKD